MSHPPDGEPDRPSVTVLTGFLGAGKTTLVNRILSTEHGRRIAVIVNEAGEIGIDGDLIVSSDEEIIEMANGCVCCTLAVRNDLPAVIDRLLARPEPPDHVIIETSGLADPAPVTQALFVEGLADRILVDGIVTMVDAAHADDHLDAFGSDQPVNRVVDQIVCADRIVLNKTDLVTGEACLAIERRIRELNSTAPVIRSCYARIDPDEILDIEAFGRTGPDSGDGFFDDDYVRSAYPDLEAVSIEVRGDLDGSKLREWLEELAERRGADIFRLKGILALAGRTEQTIVQGVHSLFEMYPGRRWPGPRRSRLVIIGRGMDEQALRSGVEGCRA